ncbi:MAG: SRPBCC family protein [Pseudanabaena sp. M165S2SP1A06QC]|jgi:uncharacterized protein YndB with AHSA1/START domain|nr:SRPBCC family protein [Rhodocyclaceae bacterium]MCA6624100.1 SRPBCC family protein [Pseudanabaena sp. M165S2SP1A06QC]
MKYAIGATALLVVIITALYVYGMQIPAKQKVSVTRTMNAPQEAIWTTITNWDQQPKWRDDLESVTVINENRFIEKPKKGSPIEFEVISSQPFSRLELNLKSSFTGTYIIKLEKIDSSTTKVTEEYELYTASPVDRLFAELFFDLESFAHKYLEQLETQSRASK